MFNKKTLTSAVLVLSAVSSFTFADTKPVGTGPNPFVDCGIGAALFPTTNWAAVSSNVIWDIGTTAVISATASPETCSGKNVKVAQFIIDTYENLAEETAKGQGEHLSAMLDIFECQENKRNSVISSVRSDMGSIIAAPQYINQNKTEKASAYYDVVNAAVLNSCSA